MDDCIDLTNEEEYKKRKFEDEWEFLKKEKKELAENKRLFEKQKKGI